jgi:hypothetical protein
MYRCRKASKTVVASSGAGNRSEVACSEILEQQNENFCLGSGHRFYAYVGTAYIFWHRIIIDKNIL